MKRLWLVLFPLMFVPNLGFLRTTRFGMIELSDVVAVPMLVVLFLTPGGGYRQQVSKLKPLLLAFLFWALLSVLSIPFRYNYDNATLVVIGCLLKIAKLTVYTIIGVLIIEKINTREIQARWMWSLLFALLVISVSLLTNSEHATSQTFRMEAYKSYNAVTVIMAMMCCYIASLWFDNLGSRNWRLFAAFAVGLAIISVMYSSSIGGHGRGGWLALMSGVGYLIVKRSRRLKTLAVVLLIIIAVVTGYMAFPRFQALADMTFSPPAAQSASIDEGIPGIDDSARIATWKHEAPKLLRAPVLGTGYFHRSGYSGLWSTGSHNFFLQMLLETGIVGGLLVILVFVRLWQQSGSLSARRQRLTTATRAALITAIVGGMSGEYFYGGGVLLALFAVTAATGSLPLEGHVAPVLVDEPTDPRLQEVNP